MTHGGIPFPMDPIPLKGWRERLVTELTKATKKERDRNDPRPSMSAASEKAKVGRNYIQQIVSNAEQDVRLDKLIAICDVLDIDLIHILTGVRWDPEIQEAVAAFAALKQHDPAAWENFRGLLVGFQERVLDEVDSNMEAASQRVRRSGKAPQ